MPASQMLGILVFAMDSCLVLNDALKVVLIRWRVPNAATTITAGKA